jgi:hypothetical protein
MLGRRRTLNASRPDVPSWGRTLRCPLATLTDRWRWAPRPVAIPILPLLSSRVRLGGFSFRRRRVATPNIGVGDTATATDPPPNVATHCRKRQPLCGNALASCNARRCRNDKSCVASLSRRVWHAVAPTSALRGNDRRDASASFSTRHSVRGVRFGRIALPWAVRAPGSESRGEAANRDFT